ncbi:NADPH-dependent FMN reductase, partial [Agrobacterium tumefaciens]|uniref:NADPH-dependent FMN reductase n=1 Tax=Agrobacterium tumefaciens TaxID=358 RepID=UPI0030135B3F
KQMSEIMTGSRHIVVLCGSLRKKSFNGAIAAALPELAPTGMTFTLMDGLDTIPHYNADIQADGFPDKVIEIANAIRDADGVAFVTPEYNYSIPGFLKNALDWISRVSPAPFAGKPVVIQTASIGVMGGVRAQYHLRQILVFLDALPMNKPEVMVGVAPTKISEDGMLTDPATREFISGQLAAFSAFIERVSP